jgi:hypothetical protein
MSNIHEEVDRLVKTRLDADEIMSKADMKLELIKGFGVDDYREDTVIRFTKVFTRLVGTKYTYAAIKADGMWYTTGPTGKRYTWTDLLLMLIGGPVPTTHFEVMDADFAVGVGIQPPKGKELATDQYATEAQQLLADHNKVYSYDEKQDEGRIEAERQKLEAELVDEDRQYEANVRAHQQASTAPVYDDRA